MGARMASLTALLEADAAFAHGRCDKGFDISIERDGRPDPMSHHDASGRVAGSIAGAR